MHIYAYSGKGSKQGKCDATTRVRGDHSGAGESIAAVNALLDQSSLQVTSIYLRRLEGVDDKGWSKVAEVIGVS